MLFFFLIVFPRLIVFLLYKDLLSPLYSFKMILKNYSSSRATCEVNCGLCCKCRAIQLFLLSNPIFLTPCRLVSQESSLISLFHTNHHLRIYLPENLSYNTLHVFYLFLSHKSLYSYSLLTFQALSASEFVFQAIQLTVHFRDQHVQISHISLQHCTWKYFTGLPGTYPCRD